MNIIGKIVVPALVGAAVRMRYTRKSTEQADRQVASHEQQYAACDNVFGPIPPACRHLWFRDDKSGTTFERPDFEAMLAVCLANPQTGRHRGIIEIYDHSRWGRPVKKNDLGKIVGVDIKAFFRYMYRLEDAGWDVVFSTGTKSEDELVTFLLDGIEIFMAGQKSHNLSRDVARGRLDWLRKGRWMGGPPPFPSKRIHPATGEELPPGTRAFNGGSLLAPDQAKVPHWIRVAEMVHDGQSLVAAAEDFELHRVPNYMAGRTKDGRLPRWSYVHIKKILTNPALIGELHHEYVDAETGEVKTEIIQAAWEPIVPVELFRAVNRKFEAKADAQVRRRHRQGVSSYIVPLMCARCGTYLSGVDTPKKNGGVNRRYRHQSSAAPMAAAMRDRIVAAGCRAWQIDADEVEEAIRDLIAEERGSPGFAERLDALLADQVDYSARAERKVSDGEMILRRNEAEQREMVRLMGQGRAAGLSDTMFLERLRNLQVQHAEASRALEDARASQKALVTYREDVRHLFDETRAILNRWENGDIPDRQAILSWWVDHVLIDFVEVERTPMNQRQRESAALGQRSARRQLIVFLATAPNCGLELELPPPHWNQKQVGHRTWRRVEIRTSPQSPASEESETLRSPSALADSCHNDGRKTVRSGGCTR